MTSGPSSKAWNTILAFAEQWWPLLLGVGGVVYKYHEDIWAFIQQIWGDIFGFLKTTWGDIETFFGSAMTTVENIFTSGWNAVKSAFQTGIRVIVDGFLTMVGDIIDGAARALGWIPGIGGKLKTAAAAFNTFRDNVNAALGGINGRTVNVGVAMTSSTNPYPGGISGRAAAGMFVSQGSGPTADDVIIRASKGELIVPASMVRAGAVDHLRGSIPGFAAGGLAGLNVTASTPGYATIFSRLMASVDKLAAAFGKAAAAAIATGTTAGQMSAAAIAALWTSLGGPSYAAANMARIAYAESGDDPSIVQAASRPG